MPTTLLQSVQVIDAASEWHGQTVDVLLENGKLLKIAPLGELSSEAADRVIQDAEYLSAGWVAAGVELNTPGHEPRETLQNLSDAAQVGGFQSLVTLPTCTPTLDNAESLLALQQRTHTLPVDFHFLATLTKSRKSERMAPIAELSEAGAVGFCDGASDINDKSLLVRLLQYTQLVDGLVVLTPQDAALAADGLVNESGNTVALGMTGIPPVAEVIAIERAIRLLAYTGGKLHLSNITTAEGVALIRNAKTRGLHLTADTAIPYLYHTDSELDSFDANLKLFPPLRTATDQTALIDGLKDGTLDCLSLHHQPRSIEEKELEFTQALPGMLTLQTAFLMLVERIVAPGHLSIERVVELLTSHVRRTFGLGEVALNEGVSVTAFSLTGETPIHRAYLAGRAYNTPLLGKTLKGRVVRVR